jgi:predicted Rossmann-fold nucleotide-binding protein
MTDTNEVLAIEGQIGPGPKCIIIGSTEFWGADSAQICEEIGRALACVSDLIVVTGGVEGVGEAVGRAFFLQRQQMEVPARVFHVLPRGEPPWDYGETLFAGDSMFERRKVLGRLGGVFVAIEGGPGTAHEAQVAISAGSTVIPVSRSGGASAELFRQLPCPTLDVRPLWDCLADPELAHSALASAVRDLTVQFLPSNTPRDPHIKPR